MSRGKRGTGYFSIDGNFSPKRRDMCITSSIEATVGLGIIKAVAISGKDDSRLFRYRKMNTF
jgi:hypothetical protein